MKNPSEMYLGYISDGLLWGAVRFTGQQYILMLSLNSCVKNLELTDHCFIVRKSNIDDIPRDKYGFLEDDYITCFFIQDSVVTLFYQSGLSDTFIVQNKEQEKSRIIFPLYDGVKYYDVLIYSPDYIYFKLNSYEIISKTKCIEKAQTYLSYDKIYTYKDNGEVLGSVKSVLYHEYRETEIFGDTVLAPTVETLYNYNKKGDLISKKSYNIINDKKKLEELIQCEYNASGYIVEKKTEKHSNYASNYEKSAYNYNEIDALISVSTNNHYRSNSHSYSSNKRTTYTYDSNSMLAEENIYEEDKLVRRNRYITGDDKTTKTTYTSIGESSSTEYNKDGCLLFTKSRFSNGENINVTYQDNLTVITRKKEWRGNNSKLNVEKDTYTYNDKGNILQSINEDDSWITNNTYSYLYDDKGNWIKRKITIIKTDESNGVISYKSENIKIEERSIEYY